MMWETINSRLIFENLLSYLPLSDKISVALTCSAWNELSQYSFKRVTINATLLHDGTWSAYNKIVDELHGNIIGEENRERNPHVYPRNLSKWQETGKLLEKKLQGLFNQLIQATSKVEVLTIDRIELHENLLEKLLSRQEKLREFRLTLCEDYCSKNFFMIFLKGIIKHQHCLEVLHTNTEDPNFGDFLTNWWAFLKPFTFDRLRSLRVSSTFYPLLPIIDIESLKKLERLEVNLPVLSSLDWFAENLQPDALVNLKELKGIFLGPDISFILENCKSIESIAVKFGYGEDFSKFCLKIISKFCSTITSLKVWPYREIIDAIVSKCKKIRCLEIYEKEIPEDSLMILKSLPDLETVSLDLKQSFVSTRSVEDLIRNGFKNLTSFSLMFKGEFLSNIFDAIYETLVNLKKLSLEVEEVSTTVTDSTLFNQFIPVLERCRDLQYLSLDIRIKLKGLTFNLFDTYENVSIQTNLANTLVTSHQKLRVLIISELYYFLDGPKEILFNGLPYCEMYSTGKYMPLHYSQLLHEKYQEY